LPLKANQTVTIDLTLSGSSSSNLALGKPAAASSESNPQQTAAMAFDGDTSTRWDANQNANSWIQVDLGTTYAIKEVDLLWEASYAKSYKLQVSADGTTW